MVSSHRFTIIAQTLSSLSAHRTILLSAFLSNTTGNLRSYKVKAMTHYGGKVNSNGVPAFEALPLRKGDPHHSAWGLYGERDELGTLNRLTGERVVSAAREEVRNGTRWVVVLHFLRLRVLFRLGNIVRWKRRRRGV
jgi:hypothetical protein